MIVKCNMWVIRTSSDLSLTVYILRCAYLSFWRTAVQAVGARLVAWFSKSLMVPLHARKFTVLFHCFEKHKRQPFYHYVFWPLNSTFNTNTRTETSNLSHDTLVPNTPQSHECNRKEACVTALYLIPWIIPDSWLLNKQDLASPVRYSHKVVQVSLLLTLYEDWQFNFENKFRNTRTIMISLGFHLITFWLRVTVDSVLAEGC